MPRYFNPAAFKQKIRQKFQRIQREVQRKVDQTNMRNPWMRYLKFHYPSQYRKLTHGETLSSYDKSRISEAMQKYARR